MLDMVCDDRSKISVVLCDWFGLAGKLRFEFATVALPLQKL